jgi:2-polyprenyl-6-methoxyphenol hydroxylase-like FAD-dependent oxidoreductase
MNKNVLISGAGIAGLTCAYWLSRYGFTPTIVERGDTLRTGGYKIDIRGTALQVIQRMGIYDAVCAAATDMQGAYVVDRQGTIISEMSGDTFGLRSGDDVEIVRGDLCQILMQQVKDVECIFGDSIQTLSQTPDTVQVEFEKNRPRSFDLVIGADGLHSKVRQLVFGEEPRFTRNLGLYLCVFSVPNYLDLNAWEIEYSDLGKIVNLFSTSAAPDAKAAFGFVSKQVFIDFRDAGQVKQLLMKVYDGIGWEVPRLLQLLPQAPDLYFDSATQICMDSWSQGRVVLLGDAGYCPSPMSGQGTSLALIGAYVLAGELAAACGDFKRAFMQYQQELRLFVQRNQELGVRAAQLMRSGEKNSLFVWLHNFMMRIAPGSWVEFFVKRAGRRIAKAANSITLKDYVSNEVSNEQSNVEVFFL